MSKPHNAVTKAYLRNFMKYEGSNTTAGDDKH